MTAPVPAGDAVNPVANWQLVQALGSALSSTDHGLGVVPGLLKKLLREEAWREYRSPMGYAVHHERFEDFVTTPPTKGLGADVELVRKIVRNDVEAETLLAEALRRPMGRPRRSIGATTGNADSSTYAPPGTGSRANLLQRLRKGRPDLYAEVLAGRLTPGSAARVGGLRPPKVYIRVDDAAAAARILHKHMPPDVLAELARMLHDPSAVPPRPRPPHPNMKLTEADVEEARRLRAQGMTVAALAKRFGVNRHTISIRTNAPAREGRDRGQETAS